MAGLRLAVMVGWEEEVTDLRLWLVWQSASGNLWESCPVLTGRERRLRSARALRPYSEAVGSTGRCRWVRRLRFWYGILSEWMYARSTFEVGRGAGQFCMASRKVSISCWRVSDLVASGRRVGALE